jgi:hypothetical protein
MTFGGSQDQVHMNTVLSNSFGFFQIELGDLETNGELHAWKTFQDEGAFCSGLDGTEVEDVASGGSRWTSVRKVTVAPIFIMQHATSD